MNILKESTRSSIIDNHSDLAVIQFRVIKTVCGSHGVHCQAASESQPPVSFAKQGQPVEPWMLGEVHWILAQNWKNNMFRTYRKT